jgi:phosphoribosylanthranilate isomerase
MTKVKICGITNLEDALLSAKFGADMLGFNFYEMSPRYIDPDKVREIADHLLEDILKVGVFVNASVEKLCEIAVIVGLDAIQLHGEETPGFVTELKAETGLEILKAFRVSPEFASTDVLAYKADAILLDAYSPYKHGGTGETFNWEIARNLQSELYPIYLAGGLTPGNVEDAVKTVRPYAVDVTSGVESSPGEKDPKKLEAFINNAKNA